VKGVESPKVALGGRTPCDQHGAGGTKARRPDGAFRPERTRVPYPFGGGSARRGALEAPKAPSPSHRSHFHFDYGEGVLQAAEAGLGIPALPDFIASDGLRSGRLASLLEDYPLEGDALFVVGPPASIVPPKVRTLIHLMVARFG
jgi:DNA-binding transcriptional LysR family regulator